MDYIYSTHVAVPESTIRQICTDMLRNTLNECSEEEGMDLNDYQLMSLGRNMNKVMDSMCHSNRTSVDGWHLDDNQIHEIASELHTGRKIPAIKAFRSATGAGLKEAKNFIDSFCVGRHHQSGPVSAIAFRATFSK